MKALIAHEGFVILLTVGIGLADFCEYARRRIKEKPKTLTWTLMSGLVYILYVLAVAILVFEIVTELFM